MLSSPPSDTIIVTLLSLDVVAIDLKLNNPVEEITAPSGPSTI